MSTDHKQRVDLFFSALAVSYDTVIPFFETFAEQLVSVAGIHGGERVLDVACGTGRCLVASGRAVGDDGFVLGTDLVVAMADLARRNADEAGLERVRVDLGDAEHLAVRTGTFDAVTCGFGVFFFPDPDAAFREAHRALRAGGRFAASTFSDGVAGYQWANDVHRSLGHGSALLPSQVLTHEGLEAALARAGFTAITSTAVEGRFVFPDVDSYLAWCWSTGTRRVLSALSDEELDRYKRLSAERLEAHAVDGGYEMRQPANVTVATRG